MEPLLITRRDAAAALNVSLRTLDSLLACGELRAKRIGRRRLILRAELEKFAQRDHKTGDGTREK